MGREKRYALVAFILIVIYFASNVLYAQPAVYRLSSEIDSVLSVDSAGWKYQVAATAYSFIGKYKQALRVWDMDSRLWPIYSFNGDTLHAISQMYKAIDARPYIIDRASKTSLVIINEAHHVPIHRVFTTSLLQDLYKLGYRHLGLEALREIDTVLCDRGYPLLTSGYYIQEPSFGNLIREACAIGFTIFEYEAKGLNHVQREITQAENIRQYMAKHPRGKFILHVGYDHAVEDSIDTWGLAMAGRVKLLTGIDPLTIDQVELTERGDPKLNHPFRRLSSSKRSVVLVDSCRNSLGQINPGRVYDIAVCHPKTTFKFGRPSWLQVNKRKIAIRLKNLKRSPTLVQVFQEGDVSDAVPLDVVEINENQDKAYLFINKRIKSYKVVIAGMEILSKRKRLRVY